MTNESAVDNDTIFTQDNGVITDEDTTFCTDVFSELEDGINDEESEVEVEEISSNLPSQDILIKTTSGLYICLLFLELLLSYLYFTHF